MELGYELNPKGFVFLLGVAATAAWQFYPLGPTWALVTAGVWYVLFAVLPTLFAPVFRAYPTLIGGEYTVETAVEESD